MSVLPVKVRPTPLCPHFQGFSHLPGSQSPELPWLQSPPDPEVLGSTSGEAGVPRWHGTRGQLVLLWDLQVFAGQTMRPEGPAHVCAEWGVEGTGC